MEQTSYVKHDGRNPTFIKRIHISISHHSCRKNTAAAQYESMHFVINSRVVSENLKRTPNKRKIQPEQSITTLYIANNISTRKDTAEAMYCIHWSTRPKNKQRDKNIKRTENAMHTIKSTFFSTFTSIVIVEPSEASACSVK